jgi:sulfoxide reductase catalytic subunit YedY
LIISIPLKPSEITPEHVYHSRRRFLKQMGIVGTGSLLAACAAPAPAGPVGTEGAPAVSPAPASTAATAEAEGTPSAAASATPALTVTLPTGTPTAPVPGVGAQNDELGDPLTSYDAATSYNNYYEFTTAKQGIAALAKDFKTIPWQVEVGGLVRRPRTFELEELLKMFPQEERIYRLRCVETWSMVIPWLGFSLGRLLEEAEPTGDARFVRFETVSRPAEMPGQRMLAYPWPYQEGLRLDEAMHNLTILATGLYGKPLPAQSGAPVRLIVPWKYGFKSIKSIVKIEVVDHQTQTMWSTRAPNEYGFYANVNPQVPHPRWSQSTERRIGETVRRDTLMFNGYAGEVAGLYAGMDLKVNF